MAKRRKKTATRRRRRGMSEGMSAKVRRRRRSTGVRRSGSALSTGNLIETGKELVGGGIGGYAGGKIYHMTQSYTPAQKLFAFGGGAFAAHFFGFKNVAAGIAGSYGFAVATGMPGMSEGEDMDEHDYTDKNALSEMCDAMDEDGNPKFLTEDGDYVYANELNDDDDMNDDDDGMGARLFSDTDYPAYVNVSNY